MQCPVAAKAMARNGGSERLEKARVTGRGEKQDLQELDVFPRHIPSAALRGLKWY